MFGIPSALKSKAPNSPKMREGASQGSLYAVPRLRSAIRQRTANDVLFTGTQELAKDALKGFTTAMKPVRLTIADDAEVIRQAVRRVISSFCPGVEVVGEAKDYTELFRLTKDIKPNVVLMDLNMPGVEPDKVRAELDSCCLLVMSAWFDEGTKARARACGALELLDKSTLSSSLRPAIERCMNHSKVAAR